MRIIDDFEPDFGNLLQLAAVEARSMGWAYLGTDALLLLLARIDVAGVDLPYPQIREVVCDARQIKAARTHTRSRAQNLADRWNKWPRCRASCRPFYTKVTKTTKCQRSGNAGPARWADGCCCLRQDACTTKISLPFWPMKLVAGTGRPTVFRGLLSCVGIGGSGEIVLVVRLIQKALDLMP